MSVTEAMAVNDDNRTRGRSDAAADRAARRAAALRENLKRRKAQARGRAATAGGDDSPADQRPAPARKE